MSNPIIEVINYSYMYPSTDELILKDVSFTVNEGDFVGIIGCNRAGKSTLCKVLVGILPFVIGGDWNGDIIIDNKNLADSNGNAASDVIGVVFQDAESQFTQETVEDEIAFSMCNFGYDKKLMRERVEMASKACGLYDMLDRSPYRLSGGQQQRLAIACILALQPRVMILDESTSQLDPIGRDDIFKLVAMLHEKGSTVIMVDHNIEKIAEYAQKILVLHKGEVVAFDDVEKVFRQNKLLNEHFVRVPQVTEASIILGSELGIEEPPITLDEAKEVFSKLKVDRS